MEPPAKRPRFGPVLLEEDDSEADELNSHPEEVNARRDPNLRLERSRAFAAFKLKSAFERIFEKYEKDFTGVGDEIDLRTGEIVVNNGHIQSLKDARMGSEDDATSEAESLNEEEMLSQGKADIGLRSLGRKALPSTPKVSGPSPLHGRGWPATAPLFGDPPRLATMMQPAQMPFGGTPIHYGGPLTAPAIDPTWSAPELPLPSFGNQHGSESVEAPPTKKKQARSLLNATPHLGGEDEDDVLLDVSPASHDGKSREVVAKKKRLSLPRAPSEQVVSVKNRRAAVTSSKQNSSAAKMGRNHGPKKTLGEQPSRGRSTAPQSDARSEVSLTRLNSVSKAQARDKDTPIEPELTRTERLTPGNTSTPESEDRGKTQDGENHEVGVAESPLSHYAPSGLLPELMDPDIYLNLSCPEGKIARKPRNQTLRVEIEASSQADRRSFRNITPESSDEDSPRIPRSIISEGGLDEWPNVSNAQGKGPPDSNRNPTPESGDQVRAASAEVFSRNFVDPAYAFSDEDEPTLPRQKTRHKSKVDVRAPGNMPDTAQNATARYIQGANVAEKPWSAHHSATARAPSPTLSTNLDDGMMPSVSSPVQSSEAQQQPSLESAESGVKSSASGGALDPAQARRTSMHPSDESSIPEPEAEVSSTTAHLETNTKRDEIIPPQKAQNSPSERRRRNAAFRAASPVALRRSRSQESPLIPHGIREPRDPSSATSEPAQDLETLACDSAGSSRNLDRGSPTLTDPSSKPPAAAITALTATSTSIPNQPPLTPTKQTPRSLASRPQQPTRSSSTSLTTTATTKKKRQSILSLISDDDDQDDELIITPRPPRSAAGPAATPIPIAIRSSPAAHHVRLSLVAASSSSGSLRKKRKSVSTPTMSTPARKGGVPGSTARGSPHPMARGTGVEGDGGEEGELVQTPGGTMRRCGEDGFVCGKPFCFACL